jgi:hypothetical protein
MPRTTLRRAALTAAGLALLLAGCGTGLREKRLPETGATLEGTVRYGGEPVLVAMVIVQGENGAGTAFIGEDGRYRIENAPLGTVHVAVNTAAGRGDMMGKMMARANGKSQGALPSIISVPARYADPMRSPITTTVNTGENTFDIVIPR